MSLSMEILVAVLFFVAAAMSGYESWRTRGLGWLALAVVALGLLLHSVSVRVVP